MTDNRPDLPELESVEVNAYSTLRFAGVLTASMFAFAGSLIWLYFKYFHYFGAELPIMTVFIGLMVATIMYMGVRAFGADYYWRTDSNGLTARGIFGRKLLKWSDITTVRTTGSGTYSATYSIETEMNKARIPSHGMGGFYLMPVLIGSIWQHLRKHGKEDGLSFSDDVDSLWDEIPESVPSAMDWENRRPPRVAGLVLALAFFLGMPLGALVLLAREPRPVSVVVRMVLLLSYLYMAWLHTREFRETTRRVTMSGDGLEATLPNGKVRIRWEDVCRARWDFLNFHRILLPVPRGGRILVPIDLRDDESCLLILAIIRRLRSVSTPIRLCIPVNLRAVAATGVLTNQKVSDDSELGLSTFERLMFSFMVGLVGLIVFAQGTRQPNPPAWQMVSVAGVIAAVCWLVGGTYILRVDPVGVSKRFLWWRTDVPWNAVTGLSVIQRVVGDRLPTRLLRDTSGNLLMRIAPNMGMRRDQERFDQVLNVYLSRILPPDQLDKPWKSKPWSPGQ